MRGTFRVLRRPLHAFTVGAAALLLAGWSPAAPAAAASPVTICDGSSVPGTYTAAVVPAGAVCDLGAGPVRVLAGVRVGAGATFMLGFEGGPATGTIGGGLVAIDAAQVQVHNASISGGVRIQGGDGAFGPQCALPFGVCFTDLEDNSINGGVTISGYDGFWLGFIRNGSAGKPVEGTVTINNNNLPYDEIDIGSNSVHGSLFCFGNVPLENVGHSPGPGTDTVTGQDTCHEATS